MWSHPHYHTRPHLGPRFTQRPGDLNTLADDLELEVARARAAARTRRGPYAYPEPDYYAGPAHYHPRYDVFEHHEHPLRRPDFRQASPYPHYEYYEQYPPFERHDDICACVSRQQPPYSRDIDYPQWHSCSPHQHMRRYSPLSSGLREPSFCGKPECAEERPEYAEWTIELDPSSPSATLVPRSRVNHDQRPILAPTARSPSYSEVRRPPSAAREDALSTVLRLLGVPEEKKESQTVSQPVQRHESSYASRGRDINKKLEATPADGALDLNDLGAAFQAFLTSLSGPTQAETESEPVPSSTPQPSVTTEPEVAPKRVSVRFDIPEASQKADGHAPVAYTYAIPASAQVSKPASDATSSAPPVSDVKPVPAERQRQFNTRAEAQQIMEAIKRSLDPTHNVQPVSSSISITDKNDVPVKDNTRPTSPVPTIVPSHANVSTSDHATSSPVRIAVRSPSPSRPKQPMDTIESIEQEFVDLEYKFKFPTSVDFLPGTSSTPSLAYTSNNMPLRSFEHALTSLLTPLDAIDSAGLAEVRDARKDLVRRIEKVLNELEASKLGVWREQNKAEGTIETPVADETKEEAILAVVEDTASSNVADSDGSSVEKGENDVSDSVVPELEAIQEAKNGDSAVQSSEETNSIGERLLDEEAEHAVSPTSEEAEDPKFPSYPDVERSSANSSPVVLPSDFDPSDMENEQVGEKGKIIDEF